MRSDCSDPPSLLLSTSSSSSESFPPTAVNTEGCEVTAHSVTQKLPLCGVRGVMWPVYYEMRLFLPLLFSNLWDKFVIDLWAFTLMSWHLVVSHDPHWVPVLKTHLQDYSADRQLTFVLKLLWKTVWEKKTANKVNHNNLCTCKANQNWSILMYAGSSHESYPCLTSFILLMKASLFSFAFLLRFSAFNPSMR